MHCQWKPDSTPKEKDKWKISDIVEKGMTLKPGLKNKLNKIKICKSDVFNSTVLHEYLTDELSDRSSKIIFDMIPT